MGAAAKIAAVLSGAPEEIDLVLHDELLDLLRHRRDVAFVIVDYRFDGEFLT